MEGEYIIEAEYCMLELVDMALGHRIKPPGFDLKVEPLDSLDVDERPIPIVKLANAQLWATFFMDNPSKK